MRRFIRHDGKVMFDEKEGILEEGWEKDLIAVILSNKLNINDGRGYHAFVLKFAEEGKVQLS